MKTKIKNLLILSVIFIAAIGILILNISKLFSNNKQIDTVSGAEEIIKEDDLDKSPDLENNVSINEYYNISEDKDAIPIENGKVLSEIYSVDIPNYSILGDFYNWNEEASRLNYFIIENAILMKVKNNVKYEVVPESMTPVDLEKEIIWSFKCRDFYTKKEVFSVGFTRQGRAIVEKIKNIVQ